MGTANSVSMTFSEEDPSANQGKFWRDWEEIEDSNKTKEKEEKESEYSNGIKEKEDEEIEECSVCKYIKGGECKESFVAIQNCVGESVEATKCKEVRKIFKTFMFDNPVYYELITTAQAHVVARMIRELQAEKETVVSRMISELQAENEEVLAGDAAAIAKALSKLQTEEQPVLSAQVAAIAKAFQDFKADKEDIAGEHE